MHIHSSRCPSQRIRFGAALAVSSIAVIAVACSSDSGSSGPGDAGSGEDAGSSTTWEGGDAGTSTVTSDAGTTSVPTSTVSTSAGTCASPTLQLEFSPMYSAFIAGSATHTFQIPAVTSDGSAATWSVTDPTQAQLVAQVFNGLSGAMITVQGTGDSDGNITVVATTADGTCGKSTLHITATTEDDWQIGDARYNDGVSIGLNAPGGMDGGVAMRPDGGRPDGGGGGNFRTSDGGSFFERDGGTACTNCHGPTATSGPYKDVSHTPEQTGGFSDDELIAIITKGAIPDGGYFDPTVIIPTCDGGATCTEQALTIWHSFHQWSDITADQYPGIITYLRSLQPQDQAGTSNFGGGRRMGDGGVPVRRDAGVSDAGQP